MSIGSFLWQSNHWKQNAAIFWPIGGPFSSNDSTPLSILIGMYNRKTFICFIYHSYFTKLYSNQWHQKHEQHLLRDHFYSWPNFQQSPRYSWWYWSLQSDLLCSHLKNIDPHFHLWLFHLVLSCSNSVILPVIMILLSIDTPATYKVLKGISPTPSQAAAPDTRISVETRLLLYFPPVTK